MAVPKRKISKSRKGMRRSHHGLAKRELTKCSRCRMLKLPHRICANCGHYKNRQVIEPDKI